MLLPNNYWWMLMDAYVINLKSEPKRWTETKKHLETLGLTVYRSNAVQASSVKKVNWAGLKLRDVKRRVAIIRSYRRLFNKLLKSEEKGPWLIVQDDVRFSEKPEHKKLVTVYNEARTFLYEPDKEGYWNRAKGEGKSYNPLTHPHVCPQAISVKREALKPLLKLLENESKQICLTWVEYLTEETTHIKTIAKTVKVEQ